MSKLKQIREQRNLTQEELSEKSGISVRTIQRIESGAQPKGHTLKTLSKILEIAESELQQTQFIKSSESLIENSEIDFSKIKLINLSSILFVVVPPLNILFPLVLSYALKQRNDFTKQIVSLQFFLDHFSTHYFYDWHTPETRKFLHNHTFSLNSFIQYLFDFKKSR